MTKKILIGIGAVILVVIVGGYLLPAKLRVEHASSIKAPPEVVFALVNDMEKSLAWDPWAAGDPTMKVRLGATKAGTGASKSWTSKNSGNGSQTITESIPNTSVKFALDFKDQGQGRGWFLLKKTAAGTELRQGFESDLSNVFMRYMGALMMKGMIREKFVQGHENIRKLAESKGR